MKIKQLLLIIDYTSDDDDDDDILEHDDNQEEQPLEEQQLLEVEQLHEEQPLEEDLPQATAATIATAAIEESVIDARERVEFEEFVRKGCCEGKCHLQFDEGYLRSVRWEMAELSKEELDMVIMSELMVCSGTDELTSANKKVTHERQRNIIEYRHKNKKVQ